LLAKTADAIGSFAAIRELVPGGGVGKCGPQDGCAMPWALLPRSRGSFISGRFLIGQPMDLQRSSALNRGAVLPWRGHNGEHWSNAG
jgi:hypothetical protein